MTSSFTDREIANAVRLSRHLNLTVSYDVSDAELGMIEQIADKFERLIVMPTDKSTIMLYLMATHASGCPLDLDGLLNRASDFDLVHDVIGIQRHLDLKTGQLRDHFLPRTARLS